MSTGHGSPSPSALHAFAVFLRGVNVGGITIRSAPLKAALLAIDGVETAGTILASGNVLVTTSLDETALKAACEAALRATFGYEAWVVVMPRTAVAHIVQACPYPSDDESVHAYVTVSSDPASLDAIEADAAALGEAGGPMLRLTPEALAWQCPAGQSTQAPVAKLFTKARYKSSTTTRNLRTFERLLAIPVA
ncbi:MAG: DUF1697 domain-containing protein [Dermatophilus congolensis]|nr:DUF1697 domain-containing protein [Dermatophilus congolensis]